MSDIQFSTDGGMFNVRVAGICVKENKIILSKMESDDFWVFIGGKVRFGESTDEAILREYREETGAQLHVDRLLSVTENFFSYMDRPWHQYLFYYLLRDDDESLKLFDGEREISDHHDIKYRWFDLSELDNVVIKPDCSAEIVRNMSNDIRHLINRDECRERSNNAT